MKKYIIAKNRNNAIQFAKRYGIKTKDVFYFGSIESMRGQLGEGKFIDVLPCAAHRKDLKDLIEYAKLRNFKLNFRLG